MPVAEVQERATADRKRAGREHVHAWSFSERPWLAKDMGGFYAHMGGFLVFSVLLEEFKRPDLDDWAPSSGARAALRFARPGTGGVLTRRGPM